MHSPSAPRRSTRLLSICSVEQNSGPYCGVLLAQTPACCRLTDMGLPKPSTLSWTQFLFFLTPSVSTTFKLHCSFFRGQTWFESHRCIFGKSSKPHWSLSSIRASYISRQSNSQLHVPSCLSWLLGSCLGPRDINTLPTLSVTNLSRNTEPTLIPAADIFIQS